MSDSRDLRSFLGAYLAEAHEHLGHANARLLEIETAQRAGRSHARPLRELFRVVHTIKGLSAMIGIEPVVEITHAVEALLRSADQGGGALAPRATEVVFRALDAVAERVRSLATDHEPAPAPRALLEAIAGLDAGAAPAAPTAPGSLALEPELAAKLAPFELESLEAAAAAGERALRIEFTPSPRRAAAGLTINSVRERLRGLGEIVKVLPTSVPATDDAPGGLRFVILFVTRAPDEAVAAACEMDPSVIRALAAPAPGAQAAPAVPLPPLDEDFADTFDAVPQQRGVLRVEAVRVDDALERLSTLIVTRSRLAAAVAALAATGANTRELQAVLVENTRQLRDLRGAILRIRMVPLAEVLARLPLVVRGVKRASGKEVRLVTEAAGAELDKAVAERVFPALVHLVQNAVDHGIEAPDARVAAGKPREGSVTVRCSATTSRHLEVEIRDDGGGVDREAVFRRAGLAPSGSDDDLLAALCRPGLSTRDVATTSSGRGMGMDIVNKVIVDQLGGSLALQSRPGEGSTFTMRVPLTVAIVDAFVVLVGGDRYVVPVSMVEEIVDVEAATVVESSTRNGPFALIARRGEAMALLDLGEALGAPPAARRARHGVVIRRGTEAVAFGLERVVAQQEVVVRPLVDPLVYVRGVAGSTDLGDGKATLVLDLVAIAGAQAPRVRAQREAVAS